MPNKKTTQRVELFGGPDTGEQSVVYSPDEQWVRVAHDGGEISCSLPNWQKLVELVKSITP